MQEPPVFAKRSIFTIRATGYVNDRKKDTVSLFFVYF